MSDLTKSKAANALVWAAFFAFWLHSLHCCRAHKPTERCVFDLLCPADDNEPTIVDVNVFHRRPRSCARVLDRSFPCFAPSPFESTSAEAPSFVRNGLVHGSRCAVAWPSLRLPTEKEIVTILRAVHKYKDSREQFEMRTHKRLIDVIRPSNKTVEALTSLELPAGVEIEIKL